MQTTEKAKTIGGDELYQKRAREALPLLVEYAESHKPVSYGAFARRMGMENPRNLNFVLGSVGVTLEDLSRLWREEIPPIQALVVRKDSSVPGVGVDPFLESIETGSALPAETREARLQRAYHDIFAYQKWPEVLNALRLQSAPSIREGSDGAVHHWWVNNGQSFEHEIAGNYVWCPKTNINGAPNWAFDNVALPVAGDVVFAYAGGHIRAVGVVTAVATTAEQPSEFGKIGENRHRPGWKLPVAFVVLKTLLRPKEHMDTLASLLPEKYSPIRASGDGNQVAYFATVPPAMAAELRRLLDGQVEAIEAMQRPPSPALSIGTADVDQSPEGILEREIFARTDISPTQKQTLVNARRGQGLFRERVIALEGKCRVTGVGWADHLRASHIKPWNVSSDHEKLDGNNGLLLAPHIDHLFDQGYISFTNFGDLIVSPKCPDGLCKVWGIDETINVGPFRLAQRRYLDYHRDNVFKPAVGYVSPPLLLRFGTSGSH